MFERRCTLGNRASHDPQAHLANAAFRALAEGGEALRWEPFFFDWLGGPASEARALSGVRKACYTGEAFQELRRVLATYEPDRPQRLALAYFAEPEPEELLYDEIEQVWRAIADKDDWSPLGDKLARIDQARASWGLDGG